MGYIDGLLVKLTKRCCFNNLSKQALKINKDRVRVEKAVRRAEAEQRFRKGGNWK